MNYENLQVYMLICGGRAVLNDLYEHFIANTHCTCYGCMCIQCMSIVVALSYMDLDINTKLSILTCIYSILFYSSKFLINYNNLHNSFP